MRPPWALLVAVCVLPECVVMRIEYGEPLRTPLGVEPGVTTTAELMDLLGPPEEYSAPRPWSANAANPQATRVDSERDLFGRRVYTWVHETRRDKAWLILPILTVFSHWRTDHEIEQITAIFDDDGIVTGIGVEKRP